MKNHELNRSDQIRSDQIERIDSLLPAGIRGKISAVLAEKTPEQKVSVMQIAEEICFSITGRNLNDLNTNEQAEFFEIIENCRDTVSAMTTNIDTTLARLSLDEKLSTPETRNLGPKDTLHLQSTMGNGEFLRFPEYVVGYPQILVETLGELYSEYNNAFASLVEKNREWETDYQYCFINGNPVNYFVQIDMPALPESFLSEIAEEKWSKDALKNMLRSRIFEFENSLAMYELLNELHSFTGESTEFREGVSETLDMLRKKHGKKIAILAVTDQKYEALRMTEFGKQQEDELSDEEILARSGFDTLLGPKEFKKILEENDGECPYLLFARTSSPVSKLKNPNVQVNHPLLGDDKMREIIKANAITFNIDNPADQDASKIINDTKEYMQEMGLAFHISDITDLMTADALTFLQKGKPLTQYSGEVLSSFFTQYLQSQGVDIAKIISGEVQLHVKPMKESYGCYGHVSGSLSNGKFRNETKKMLKDRGQYVVQLQMPVAHIANTSEMNDDGSFQQYGAIHRNFYRIGENGEAIPMEGFINMIPMNNFEAHKGNIHGNAEAVWGKVNLQAK